MIGMTALVHRPRGRDLEEEPSRWWAALRAVLTVLVVTAVVAAALGGVTYLAAQVFIGMLS
jgi:hypothetical protein